MPSETENQQLLSSYEARATIVRLFMTLTLHDRVVAHSVLSDLGRIVGTNGRPKTPAKQAPKKGTNFETAARALLENNNQHMTKSQLKEVCGFSDNSVHTLLYTTNRFDFVGLRSFKGKASGFRLTEQGLRKAEELMK